MPKKDQLLGWDVSPYTAKVRSYFNYKKIPFDYKPPSAYTLSRKVQPATGKMIMPTIFRSDGSVLQDSSVIIDTYEQQFPQLPVIPDGPRQAFASLLLELFADEWLPLADLHYRWNYKGNYKFIIGEFGKNALHHFPKFIQTAVAKQFAGKMSGYLPVLGVTKKMEAALEVAVEEFLASLNNHFKEHSFMFGNHPTIGDFAIYGPLYAHLDRDPEPEDLIKKYHHLHQWLMRMHGSFEDVNGHLLPEDQIPETLLPVLQIIAELHGPLLQQTIDAIEQWHKKNPDIEKLPQRLGDAEIAISGKTETRFNLTYAYWMVQRMRLIVAERGSVESFAGSLKLAGIFNEPLPIQVELRRTRLYRA